jgi:ribose transport system ATP-binding protein
VHDGDGARARFLVKILSGYHHADAGSRIAVGGTPLDRFSPERIREAGLRFVHQEATVVPTLSVLENFSVGDYRTGFAGRIRWAQERSAVQNLLDEWIGQIDVRAPLSSLSQAEIAKFVVLRAMRSAPGETITALILDEPTAALGQEDAPRCSTGSSGSRCGSSSGYY